MRSCVMMGIIGLGLTGCSESLSGSGGPTNPIPSEDHELMSTHPRRPPPDPEIEILPDDPPPPEPPPPPLEACLPGGAGPSLALGTDDLRVCFNRAGNLLQPDDACLWVGKNGSVRVDVPPAEAGPATITARVAGDALSARVCRPGVADCLTLTPPLAAGETIQQAALDATGERVALLLQAIDDGDGTVAIHDTRDGREIARGTRRWRHRGKVSYEIGYLGAAIMWIEYPGALEPGNAQLWKTKRTRLKPRKVIPHRVSAWGPLGRDRYVFTGEDTRAEIWDIKRARRVSKIDLGGLVVGDAEHAAWRELDSTSELATAPTSFALLVHTAVAARVAFVDTSTRKPRSTIVSIPVCAAPSE